MTIRSDNADLRLTEKGTAVSSFASTLAVACQLDVLTLGLAHVGRVAGTVSDTRWSHFLGTRDDIARVTEMLKSFALSPQVRTDVFSSYIIASCLWLS